MDSRSPLDVAIMGFGLRGEAFSHYAREYPDQVRIAAVVDPNLRRQERARDLFGADLPVYGSGSEFFAAQQRVDGVWVMSQERTHAELAVPALERDIPLITEKPLATTIEDASRIVNAFNRHSVTCSIPHSLRYSPGIRKLKELVTAGTLGQILHIHAAEQIGPLHTVFYYRRGPGMFRKNTFFLLAKCCHDIDVINWLMDSQATTVASFGGTHYFTPRDDVPRRCSDGCSQLKVCSFGPKSIPDEIRELAVFQSGRDLIDIDLCAWNSPSEQVDHQTVILQYANGATADFTLRCFGDAHRPIQVMGSDATASYDVDTNELRVVHTTDLSLRDPSLREAHVEVFGPNDLLTRNDGPHGGRDWALIEDWVDAVHTGRPTTSATIHEAAEAVVVCVAADTAMRERRVVDVNELRPPALTKMASDRHNDALPAS